MGNPVTIDCWRLGVAAGRRPVDIRLNKHCGVWGTTGSGKTTVMMLMVEHIAECRGRGLLIEVWCGDPPEYMGIMRDIFTRYAITTAEHVDMWKALRAEYDRRMALRSELVNSSGQHIEELGPEHGVPRLIILQDELSSIIQDCGTKYDLAAEIAWAAKNFRKAGMYLVLADQDPQGKNVPAAVKYNLATVIALRVENRQVSQNCFGDQYRSAPAHTISPRLKGRCYVKHSGADAPELVQAYFLPADEVPGIVDRYRKAMARRGGGGSGGGSGVGVDPETRSQKASNALLSGPGAATPTPAPKSATPDVVAEAVEKGEESVPGVYWTLRYSPKPLNKSELNRAIFPDRDNRGAIDTALRKLNEAGIVEADGNGWRLKEAS